MHINWVFLAIVDIVLYNQNYYKYYWSDNLESLVYSIVDALDNSLGSYGIIFIVSMLPILELRGGVLAASLLGVDWRMALPICIIGNFLPIPFIFLFFKKILERLKNTRFVKFVNKLEKKIEKKSASITKYEKWGLFFFVAIPLPGTGAWTGSMIAALFDMPLKDSIIAILGGVLAASLIMLVLSYGVLGFFM